MSEMGITLKEVQNDIVLMKEFQNNIINAKIESLRTNSAVQYIGTAVSDNIILTERSFGDIYAYTEHWMHGLLEQHSFSESDTQNNIKWLYDYREKCIDASKYIDGVLYFPDGKFAHVDDGVRADAKSQHSVAASILNFFNLARQQNVKLIQTMKLENRIDEAADYIKDMYINYKWNS